MARKAKITKVKCTADDGGKIIVKAKFKTNILPDEWDYVHVGSSDVVPDAMLWIKAGEDPVVGEDQPRPFYKYDMDPFGYDFNYYYFWFQFTNAQPGMIYHMFVGAYGESGTLYRSSTEIDKFVVPGGGGGPMLMLEGATGWEDFTDCITVPDYKVNNEEITEEWEDGDYNTHSNIVATRIKGSFNLRFQTRQRLNRYMGCVKYSESKYGKGRVRMMVQVNNEVDVEDMVNPDQTEFENALPMTYIDIFKMGWEPDWSVPFFGTSHDYSGISVNIEEIED